MIYVLYHDNCLDGLGAKYAAWKKFNDKATYIPVNYNEPFPMPELGKYGFEDTIYILDFSYPKDILLDIASTTGVMVIDHHKSAMEDLQGLDFAIFDMNKSGAVLAWEYFYPNEEVPDFLLLIQDRDLWQFKLPETKPVTTALYNHPRKEDPKYWDSLVTGMSVSMSYGRVKASSDYLDLLNAGNILLEQQQQIRQQFLDDKRFALKCYNGHRIAVFNTTSLISELAETVYKAFDLDYVVSFFIHPKPSVIFSYRASESSNVDVSQIAKILGGGGHKKAAGASVSLNKGLFHISDIYASSDLEL